MLFRNQSTADPLHNNADEHVRERSANIEKQETLQNKEEILGGIEV